MASTLLEDQRDAGGKLLPERALLVELAPAGVGQGVVFGATAVRLRLPVGDDPRLVLESVQRRVERTLLDLERLFRDLPDPVCDGPAVKRFEGDDAKDQEVEGALEKVGRLHLSIIYT